MIDQLLAHRDAIPYALAVGCIVLATAMGYLLADKDPAQVCAEYVVKVERLQKQIDELGNPEIGHTIAKKIIKEYDKD